MCAFECHFVSNPKITFCLWTPFWKISKITQHHSLNNKGEGETMIPLIKILYCLAVYRSFYICSLMWVCDLPPKSQEEDIKNHNFKTNNNNKKTLRHIEVSGLLLLLMKIRGMWSVSIRLDELRLWTKIPGA